MYRWFNNHKEELGGLIILALLVILWQTLKITSAYWPDAEYAKNRHLDVVRRVSQSVLKPGDIVFLSTQNPAVQEAVAQSGARLYQFASTDAAGFEAAFVQALNERCGMKAEQDEANTYFVWTKDQEQTAMELSKAARGLNFFYYFQAILPYQGSEAFTIDNFLRLHEKEDLIQRYCEATRLAEERQVLLIVDTDAFSPWIGSITTGPVTWLAGDPTRNMEVSDFAVIDMPPLITYDVYWMGQLDFIPYWTFTNQDRAAYEQAVEQAKAHNSIVLVDRDTKLGVTPQQYLEKCPAEQRLLRSELFRQMCLK